jgi:hypothetical protein
MGHVLIESTGTPLSVNASPHPARFAALVFVAAIAVGRAADPSPPRPKQDAKGNPIRYAATGHVSNYDEAKVGNNTLPDPLILQSGESVRDADTWNNKRRPEILKLYETEIYGRVPATAPKARFEVLEPGTSVMEGAAIRKHVVVHFGPGPEGPKVNVVLYLPAKPSGPVPLLLQLVFLAGLPSSVSPATPPTAAPAAAIAASAVPTPGATTAAQTPPRPRTEAGPVADIIGRGYGYATLRYTEIEGDRADTNLTGVRKLALASGQEKPAADEWGTVAAWSWGASRVLDYFETDRAIDAKRVGIIGHSRLGKTVLWAGASDPRFAVIFSSCSGEMGASLARRDYGETIDDMAANFPWQFAGNFQKYSGHWNDMPVDSHLLIALAAPRPVFVTGGTEDQWADPHGEFLAQVAAGPVYRLLAKKDLGTKELPPLDMPLITGDLGFHYHTGGHTITSSDWSAFLEFAGRYLRPRP